MRDFDSAAGRKQLHRFTNRTNRDVEALVSFQVPDLPDGMFCSSGNSAVAASTRKQANVTPPPMEAVASRFGKEGPTDARQIRSREALTAALLALLEEKPFDQITIREITTRAKTGYATFFRHYPAKEALLSDVASEEISGLLGLAIPILYDSNSFETTRVLCAYVAEHRKLWFALLTGGAASIVREEFIRQARALAEGVQTRENWLPADLAVVHGTGGTIDLLAWWLAQKQDYPSDQIAGILDRLIIAPLVGGMAIRPRDVQ